VPGPFARPPRPRRNRPTQSAPGPSFAKVVLGRASLGLGGLPTVRLRIPTGGRHPLAWKPAVHRGPRSGSVCLLAVGWHRVLGKLRLVAASARNGELVMLASTALCIEHLSRTRNRLAIRGRGVLRSRRPEAGGEQTVVTAPDRDAGARRRARYCGERANLCEEFVRPRHAVPARDQSSSLVARADGNTVARRAARDAKEHSRDSVNLPARAIPPSKQRCFGRAPDRDAAPTRPA
jgi:hypothetical protein